MSKKKIRVDQLKTGMFVDDFNCSWLDHPFFGNSTKIRDEKVIERIIKNGISEVFIDTDRGLDVTDVPAEETHQEMQDTTRRSTKPGKKPSDTVSVHKELVKAKEIKKEAEQAIRSIMEDARFGRPLRTESFEPVIERMIASILRNSDALVCLGRIKKADEYTYMHSISVCALMLSFSRYLGVESQQLKEIGIGALLHDIGKVMMPREILHCRRTLSAEEYRKMKEHVVYSRIMLEQTRGVTETSVQLAAEHHERINGSGYPEGLKNDEISLFGQAAAIADVYDALTSERCYKSSILPTMALKRLYETSGHYFNGEMVQKFIRCIGIYPVGTLVRLKNNMIAVVLNHDENHLLNPVVRVIFDIEKGEKIMPYDIDLSENADKDDADKIIGCESADRINVVPEAYL